MAKKMQIEEKWAQDFSDDECKRRMDEIIRRGARMPPTFSLETGQPFDGPQLSPEELRRRGYA